MPENIDLYSSVHKGQRLVFFKISSEAGTIDYADEKTVENLYRKLEAFREHMALHAKLEEKFIHPLLSERVPGGARRLEEDHRIMHQRLNELVTHFENVKSKPMDFEKHNEIAFRVLPRLEQVYVFLFYTH